jgi:hypothetical protein
MAEFEDRLSGLGAAIGKGISVTGTFNAAAVAGLGTGGDAAERTAAPASRPPRTPSVCWTQRGQRTAGGLIPFPERSHRSCRSRCFEKFESRRSTKANQTPRRSWSYIVRGTDDDLAARNAAR